MKLAIFGAKSTALGICLAIRKLFPEYEIETFLVSSLKDNPVVLAGLPVQEIGSFQDKEIQILVGTPEDLHGEIIHSLKMQGFSHCFCINSFQEAQLMEKYFYGLDQFHSIHTLSLGNEKATLQVYQAKHYKDKPLNTPCVLPDWIIPMQVGAILADERVAEETDCVGDNISLKNANYCELTALYWIWKNRLSKQANLHSFVSARNEIEYYGLYHYRRILDISDKDLFRMKKNSIDVILPYPTIHEPNMYEHHVRYINEQDWGVTVAVLEELEPEYAAAFPEILMQPYLYNYNICIAKRHVLSEYCAWLFPILTQIEERSVPKGARRSDRYIGYIAENLMTLYFLYHKNDMNIMHTGRIMLV